MSTFTVTKKTKEIYIVEGDLTIFSLDKKALKAFDFIKTKKNVCISFERVTLADSAGLALIIELIKGAKLTNTKLSFKQIPHQLSIIAKLSGLNINQYILNQS
ncbi:MAG: anti-anti-sigma factor [Methylococcaceae bacterium]|nr:anti-anti-sigma factor [Methylococcaceae bacterium]